MRRNVFRCAWKLGTEDYLISKKKWLCICTLFEQHDLSFLLTTFFFFLPSTSVISRLRTSVSLAHHEPMYLPCCYRICKSTGALQWNCLETFSYRKYTENTLKLLNSKAMFHYSLKGNKVALEKEEPSETDYNKRVRIEVSSSTICLQSKL